MIFQCNCSGLLTKSFSSWGWKGVCLELESWNCVKAPLGECRSLQVQSSTPWKKQTFSWNEGWPPMGSWRLVGCECLICRPQSLAFITTCASWSSTLNVWSKLNEPTEPFGFTFLCFICMLGYREQRLCVCRGIETTRGLAITRGTICGRGPTALWPIWNWSGELCPLPTFLQLLRSSSTGSKKSDWTQIRNASGTRRLMWHRFWVQWNWLPFP